MAGTAKKAREHHQFEVFREVCEVAPSGIACVQECPDFLIRDRHAYIGVELTQYFKPAIAGRRVLQEQHALQARIVDRAQAIYEAATGERLRVNVLFRPITGIGKRQATELASALATFISQCPITDLHQRFDPWHAGPELRAVTAVYAYNCPDGVRTLWRIATAGTVRPLAFADIQEVIPTKQADVRRYDRRAIQNWLVIVLDGSAASFATLTESARTAIYSSAFSQVHFLDIPAGTCTQFHLAASGD